jgi:hypothetical protein
MRPSIALAGASNVQWALVAELCGGVLDRVAVYMERA